MPQFDFYSFSGQVFWSLSGFFIFYFFILRYYLVQLAEVFKIRQKLFNLSKTISAKRVGIYDIFIKLFLKKG